MFFLEDIILHYPKSKWHTNRLLVYLLFGQLVLKSTNTIIAVPSDRNTIVTIESYKNIATKKGLICPILQGGLGNRLFQFSTAFAAAMSKDMDVLIPSKAQIRQVFEINVKYTNISDFCKGFPKVLDKASPTYNTIDLSKHIKDAAEQEINKILQKRNIKSRQNITLVGVHIRRGDKVGNNDGFNIATPDYLNRSVNYYVTKYKFVLFIVISDGMKWSKDNMPSHVPIEYVSLGKRDLDMATVVACDHTIMTIGTFGWWIGYLTNGEVVYLKDAAKKVHDLKGYLIIKIISIHIG
ncbi:FUT1_2 [Mytilus edulis]|uniref:L-Fucosyltransferase n=1 Tax=Mytilus edulis TaxID=6550 RepID=A0A8S3VGM8_MYTED|nr:FUT1_2 [Mytilus edulis]